MNLQMSSKTNESKRITSNTTRIARTLILAALSMCSIQAAAFGPPSDEERAQHQAKLQAACGADFANFCPTATDHRAKFDCLRTNEASLSATCSAFVAEMKAHRPPRPPRDDAPAGDSSSASSSAN